MQKKFVCVFIFLFCTSQTSWSQVWALLDKIG